MQWFPTKDQVFDVDGFAPLKEALYAFFVPMENHVKDAKAQGILSIKGINRPRYSLVIQRGQGSHHLFRS